MSATSAIANTIFKHATSIGPYSTTDIRIDCFCLWRCEGEQISTCWYQIVVRNYSPIQLLRPPGLCKLVCPILTVTYSEAPFPIETLGKERKTGSLPSISGLGAPTVDDEEEEINCPPKGGPNKSSLDAAVLGIDMKDSACHSYQTWCSLVSRQMDTWSSELLGRYNGSLIENKQNGYWNK